MNVCMYVKEKEFCMDAKEKTIQIYTPTLLISVVFLLTLEHVSTNSTLMCVGLLHFEQV